MRSSLAVSVAPAVEPVTTALASSQARIDSTADAALVALYISTARELAESFLSRALITQTLVWTVMPERDNGRDILNFCGEWWRRRALELPRAPVQSVTSVVIRDDLGVDTTISPTNYTLDKALEPARLTLDWSAIGALSTITFPVAHIQVTFVAGYGADATNIPNKIINAILLMTSWLYEHRGDTDGEMPPAAEMLLWPHRITFFG